MGLLIKADGTRTEIIGAKENGALSYEQLKQAVGGGFIEAVQCDPAATGGYDHFYCDEEGKLKGFPPNREATKLSTYTMLDDVVVGDVIFCKRGGPDGEESF